MYVDAAYCYRPPSVVGLPVCRYVTVVSPAKTAEPIEPCIRWGPGPPMGRGNFWWEKERPVVKYSDSLPWAVQQELSSCLDGRLFGHNRHWPKSGGLLCPIRGELGPHLTQCGLGRGLPPYQVASWSIEPFGHNRHGSKSGGCCAYFRGGGAVSPSITQCCLGGGLPYIPNGIVIHPTVWSQYTNVTDRQDRTDRTDNGPIS